MKINVFSRVVILKKIVEKNVCIEKFFFSFTVYMTDENYIGFYVIYILLLEYCYNRKKIL